MPILRIFGGEIVFDYEVISCFDIQQATFQSQISLRIIAKLLENPSERRVRFSTPG